MMAYALTGSSISRASFGVALCIKRYTVRCIQVKEIATNTKMQKNVELGKPDQVLVYAKSGGRIKPPRPPSMPTRPPTDPTLSGK